MRWIDIGANLTDSRLSETSDLLATSAQAGVERIICIGTNVEHSRKAVALSHTHNEISATVGVHPHYAKDAPAHFQLQLAELAQSEQVVAMGECGLDFNRDFSPRPTQLKVFEAQLELATELQLPIYLHERDAFDEQIALLRRYRSGLKSGIVHCFTGNRAQLEAYLELDLYIGITGWVCDQKRASDLRQAIAYLPLERMLLETDAPYLIPKSIRPRPKNNSPAFLPHVAEEIANLCKVELAKISEHSYSNAMKVFNFPANPTL